MRIHRAKASTELASVTAVIPCYNYGKYLPHVVQSVLSQERVNANIIIVDDASTDGSLDVAKSLAAADSRITVIGHDLNMGHIATYNDGLARVESEFVTLVSADDLLSPGALSRATDLMMAHSRVGLVYGLPVEFHGDETPADRTAPQSGSSWTLWTGREWLRLACLRGRNFIFSPEAVMRTAAMRQIGPYNAELPHSADFEYWLRTAVNWDVGRINGPAQAYYRVHGSNMHLTNFGTMQVDLEHRLAAFQVLGTSEVVDQLPEGPDLLQRARRGLCREALLLAERTLDSGGPTDIALSFLQVARCAYPSAATTFRGRTVHCRLRRALRGKGPARIQSLVEGCRFQLNRVRWVAWRKVGIS